MAPRIAWYALGGGAGHLNRALAVLRHLRPRVSDAGVVLLTSSPFVHLAIQAGVPVARVPGAAEAASFPKGAAGLLAAALLRELAPLDLLVVDTFADGLHLELNAEVLGLAAHKALIYREGGVVPGVSPAWEAYDRILAPYPVSPHPDAEAMGYVLNRTPGEALSLEDARRRLGLSPEPRGPLIMAMHAGDPGEVLGFFGQARAASRAWQRPHELRLVTPLPLPGEPWPEVCHVYPASEVLGAADVVMAGGGYNSVAELRAFGKRAVYRPFDRSHDVQGARLADHEAVIGPLDGPEELIARWEHALALPAPAPGDPRDYEGALRIAQALASMVK